MCVEAYGHASTPHPPTLLSEHTGQPFLQFSQGLCPFPHLQSPIAAVASYSKCSNLTHFTYYLIALWSESEPM